MLRRHENEVLYQCRPRSLRRTRNVSHDIEEVQKTQVKVALVQEEHFLDWSS